MQKSRKAFTMLELIFAIVVIGILSAIAIPKFELTKNDAVISKAKSTIASVRTAIATKRQKNILKGVVTDLNATSVGLNFGNVLAYGVKQCSSSRCAGWSTSGNTYTFHGPTGDVVFNLTNNKLDCDTSTTPNLCHDYQ